MADLRSTAAGLDAADPLRELRDRFALEDGVTYLDGNSLGALPRNVPARVGDVIEREWGRLRIRSWTESGWWDAPQRVGDRLAPLLGAPRGTVVVGDSTSVNIFRALVAALRLNPGRTEIVVDRSTFPTDGYIAQSVARLTGATIKPAAPAEIGDVLSENTAVVLLNHVDYRTGRRHDLPGLTALAHNAGARIVWDLSHSAGVMPIGLEQHNVDLAVGCTYKYLNGGPGAPAYFYVRADLIPGLDQPLAGWCSHIDPFAMEAEYRPAGGIAKARGGTPEILSLLALDAALDVWFSVRSELASGAGGMVDLNAVRQKALSLTEFFQRCVRELTPLECLTPLDENRGGQISLACPNADKVMDGLIARDVVGDYRPPDILRFGFAPLYIRYADALRAAETIAEVLR
jgi:kynureninase